MYWQVSAGPQKPLTLTDSKVWIVWTKLEKNTYFGAQIFKELEFLTTINTIIPPNLMITKKPDVSGFLIVSLPIKVLHPRRGAPYVNVKCYTVGVMIF